MRIVIPEGAEFVQKPEHLDPLRRLGELVVSPGHPRDRADFIERVKDADVVVLDYTLMDEEVLARCPRLKLVAFLGIGYASCIDIEAATRRGIVVSNTPDYGATSVAEHCLGMILALTRHIATSYVSLKEGRWEPGRFQGSELRGKTLGLVGLGPIGQEMARLGAVGGHAKAVYALCWGPLRHLVDIFIDERSLGIWRAFVQAAAERADAREAATVG